MLALLYVGKCAKIRHLKICIPCLADLIKIINLGKVEFKS